MDTYSILREFADSWFLIAMFAFFVGTAIWVFLPGRRKASEDAAGIPFREAEPETDSAATTKDDPKGHRHG